jgi:hypothetical protein
VADFFEQLYGGLTRTHQLCVWSLPDKRSRWFSVPEEIEKAERAAQAASSGDELDVYWGLGLQPVALSAGDRGKAVTVSGIPGAWADIDFSHNVHKKPNLPPTLQDAIDLVHELPLPPTLIIESGHGIYALWLFHEPWEFDTDVERDEAAWMLKGWQQAVRARARIKGWDVDATHDLTRVLRIPGTVNFKERDDAKPVKVTIVDYGRRYSHEELELYLVDDNPALGSDVTPADLSKDFVPADVPGLKFVALMDNEERFKASWEHKRDDFQDQSMSSYDLSLSSLAADNGWTDEELASLIAAHRKKYGDEKKGQRVDYLARTIGVARRRADLDQRATAAGAGDTTALTAGNLQDVSRHRWQQLGIGGVVDWYVVKGDRNEFVLVSADGELRFSAADLGMYSSAARLMALHLGSTLIAMRQPAWLGECASLYRMAEPRGTMPDVQSDVTQWLEEFIKGYGLHTDMEGRRKHLDTGGSVQIGNRVCFRPARFLRFVQAATGDDRMRISELRALWLRGGGKVNDRVNLDDGGGAKCWSMELEGD